MKSRWEAWRAADGVRGVVPAALLFMSACAVRSHGRTDLVAAAPAAVRPAVPGAPTQVLAFVDVNVVPMDRERVLSRQTVLVQNGWITALGSMATVNVPPGAVRIDARGQYLIPGLADMHAHLALSGGADSNGLFRWLAYGVTTIRNMDYLTSTFGEDKVLKLRAQAVAGEILSPRIYTAGGLGVDEKLERGTKIKLADVAAKVVAYKAQGYDFIKPYHMRLELFDSVAAAARRVGIPLMGHVPDSVSLEQALASAAYRSIEHLTGFHKGGVWSLADEDPARFSSRAAATQRAGVSYTPTQAANETILAYQFPEMQAGPRRDSILARNTLALARTRQLIKVLHDAGVNLLLGVDPGIPIPGAVERGSGAHEELAALVRAGLTPYQALLTGTRNVAAFFGTLDSTGTVSVGKRADLVLLAGNPLIDIHRTQQIAGVMLGGRWLDRAVLERRVPNIRRTTTATP